MFILKGPKPRYHRSEVSFLYTQIIYDLNEVGVYSKGLRINKQWEVIALEQLTSRIEQVHNNRDPIESLTITPPGMR